MSGLECSLGHVRMGAGGKSRELAGALRMAVGLEPGGRNKRSTDDLGDKSLHLRR